ncbi:hypothetical protein D3C78_1391600 [compost metagenome]
MQNASEPRPLLTGSTMVITAAAAMAASTALPPAHSMRKPACAPRGWEVDTPLRAKTGTRTELYGLPGEKGAWFMGVPDAGAGGFSRW